MSEAIHSLRRAALLALEGRSAHVAIPAVLDGLDWQLAGRIVPDAPYTIFQELNHMIYWLEYFLQWASGPKPVLPDGAKVGWPGPAAPASARDWDDAKGRFLEGFQAMQDRAREGELLAPVEKGVLLLVVQAAALHNSYHAGQIVLLRRMLGAWPPPGGGDTW